MQKARYKVGIAQGHRYDEEDAGSWQLLHNGDGRGEAVDYQKWDEGAASCGCDSRG